MTSWLNPLLLSMALVLTSATCLRLPGVSVGPGEALLVLWLAMAGIVLARSRISPLSSMTGLVFTVFWGLSALAMMLGATFGVSQDLRGGTSARHDLLAYGLSLVLSLGLALYPLSDRELRRLVLIFTVACIVPIALLWFYAQFQEWLGPVDLWYGLRYAGWATNPNQTALLMVVVPFLVLHHIEGGAADISHDHLVGWSLMLSMALVIGWATDSGALRLAWTCSFGLLLLAVLWLGRRKRAWATRYLLAILFGLLLAAMCDHAARNAPIKLVQAERIQLALDADVKNRQRLQVPGLRLHPEIHEGMPGVMQLQQIYYEGGDLGIRMSLIINGIKAILSAPLVGHGPGSYSGLDRPFQGSESHNSLVDWGTNGGLIGMLTLLTMLGWLGRRLWLAEHYSLLAGLLALLIFAQFHHVLRHPLLWAFLVLASRLVRVGARPPSSGSLIGNREAAA